MSKIDTVSQSAASTGAMGQKLLASGDKLAMRLWQEKTTQDKSMRTRDYETVGYVVSGKVRVVVGDDTKELGPGQSWLVPAGASHTYEVLEPLTAVEATAPPARDNR